MKYALVFLTALSTLGFCSFAQAGGFLIDKHGAWAMARSGLCPTIQAPIILLMSPAAFSVSMQSIPRRSAMESWLILSFNA